MERIGKENLKNFDYHVNQIYISEKRFTIAEFCVGHKIKEGDEIILAYGLKTLRIIAIKPNWVKKNSSVRKGEIFFAQYPQVINFDNEPTPDWAMPIEAYPALDELGRTHLILRLFNPSEAAARNIKVSLAATDDPGIFCASPPRVIDANVVISLDR